MRTIQKPFSSSSSPTPTTTNSWKNSLKPVLGATTFGNRWYKPPPDLRIIVETSVFLDIHSEGHPPYPVNGKEGLGVEKCGGHPHRSEGAHV